VRSTRSAPTGILIDCLGIGNRTAGGSDPSYRVSTRRISYLRDTAAGAERSKYLILRCAGRATTCGRYPYRPGAFHPPERARPAKKKNKKKSRKLSKATVGSSAEAVHRIPRPVSCGPCLRRPLPRRCVVSFYDLPNCLRRNWSAAEYAAAIISGRRVRIASVIGRQHTLIRRLLTGFCGESLPTGAKRSSQSRAASSSSGEAACPSAGQHPWLEGVRRRSRRRSPRAPSRKRKISPLFSGFS